jgi:hypothetical protein
MNIPYTYLIGWSHYKKFYYGVRFSKDCHPSDLFVKYFTSSKSVACMINEHGMPDIIQIRKTFSNEKDARCWEHKVLSRIKAVERNDFLNRTDNLFPFCKSNILKGDDRTHNQKKATRRHSALMRGRISKKRKPIIILGNQYESINYAIKELNISTSLLYYIINNDVSECNTIDEIKKLVWIRRSEKLKQCKHSVDACKKISKSLKGRSSPRKGAIVTNATKQKLSDSLTGKKPQIVICPHCNKNGGINTMKRWHFDKCKYKDNVAATHT